jgi:glycosyltransferase involved in cell wall biosynthesis
MSRVRLGVYSDTVYRRDAETLSNHQAFLRFVTGLPPRVREVVLFGRLDPEPGRSAYAIPDEGVRFVALPFYRRVRSLGALLRSVRRSGAIFSTELDRLDAVWIFGPHPMAVVFAWIARRKRVPLVLGVRQDYPQYVAHRLPSRRWRWAVPVAHGLDLAFRLLARRVPTVTVGDELARRYRGGAAVLSTGFSLVRASDLRELEQSLSRSWEEDELRVLSVGRLDPEKNPTLLLEVLEGLLRRDERWRLTIVGDGPLRGELEAGIADRGLAERASLLGEVPNGPTLWDLYRKSHAFLHVSLTEGLPQVLFEAQAAGVPIVATAVGGVRAAVADGEAAVLIPPNDAAAGVEALERLRTDETLRRRLVTAGNLNAASESMEAQLDRLVDFFGRALPLEGVAAEPLVPDDQRSPQPCVRPYA